MKPLLFLVADSECAATLRGFFERKQFHRSLGCGEFLLDPEKDIRVHPRKDPGVWKDPQTILYAERHNYERAFIILDAAWEGAPKPEQIAADIEVLAEKEAKWKRDRFEVIVITPELEAWIWQDNPHVEAAFDYARPPSLREWLSQTAATPKQLPVAADLDAGLKPLWSADDAKPADPKLAVEVISKLYHSGPRSGLYNEIAGHVSVRHCVDPAFAKLKTTLRKWFPQ